MTHIDGSWGNHGDDMALQTDPIRGMGFAATRLQLGCEFLNATNEMSPAQKIASPPVIKHGLLENPPFMDDFPIETSIIYVGISSQPCLIIEW